MRFETALFSILAAAWAVAAVGQEPRETLRLKDGRAYRGLIEAENERQLEFAEIVKTPGRPMYAVVHSLDRAIVSEIVRLPPKERTALAAEFQSFRNRARIEAGRMEDVRLEQREHAGLPRLHYTGSWFTLDSSADEETTRRVVVRVEQVFRAYRRLLPPRRVPEAPVQILLFGSMAEYRSDLARRQIEIENPAFFSSSLNLISAGSDLARYSEQLARTRVQHAAVRRNYESLQADFRAERKRLAEELRRNGFSGDEISEELRLRQRRWDDELKTRFDELLAADRRNEALFEDVTRRMFARLFHEAFHAYVANYVQAEGEEPMPRWLNEGLAQIFETAQLDGDVLRIDAPHRETLQRLAAELAGEPLPLAELLGAREEAFLVTHARGASQRHYLYSWGLAYYLAFHQNLLGGSSFDRYLAASAETASPIARFEKLVGAPLAEFETAWRAEMKSLRAPAR